MVNDMKIDVRIFQELGKLSSKLRQEDFSISFLFHEHSLRANIQSGSLGDSILMSWETIALARINVMAGEIQSRVDKIKRKKDAGNKQ